ncbi:MAG TPA: hypothetical protein DCL77_18070, partial [Prolixibacteraceae bacterium]|nr:hypothetical protein [Prolixibacteraceae bacterium]
TLFDLLGRFILVIRGVLKMSDYRMTCFLKKLMQCTFYFYRRVVEAAYKGAAPRIYLFNLSGDQAKGQDNFDSLLN